MKGEGQTDITNLYSSICTSCLATVLNTCAKAVLFLPNAKLRCSICLPRPITSLVFAPTSDLIWSCCCCIALISRKHALTASSANTSSLADADSAAVHWARFWVAARIFSTDKMRLLRSS